MKIDSLKSGLATAIIFALAWVICSFFVSSMPLMMMHMTGTWCLQILEICPGTLGGQGCFTGWFYGPCYLA